MISVDDRVAAALREREVTIRPRVTWEQGNLSGTPVNSIDVSDRLVSFPGAALSVGAFLDGAKTFRESLVLENSDGSFTPQKAGGYFENRTGAERLMARMRVELGVKLRDGSFGYAPLYTGFVEAHVCPPGTAEFDLVSPFAMLQRITIPEDIVIEPYPHSSYGDTPASLIKQILTDNTSLDATADFDFSWDFMETLYRELDWCIGGRIRAGTPITSAINALAASGCGTVVPGEDGKIRFVSNLPEQFAFRNDHYGDVIDSSRASDWNVVEAVDVACTAVSVAYNSVSLRYPNAPHDAEDDVGKLHRMVACPYIYLARTAWLAAYTLYTQAAVETTPLQISWAMGLEGVLIQVGDRVRVNPEQLDAVRTVRIVSKAIGSGQVFLTGVTDGHESSIIQGSFAEWGSTTWGDTTEVLF